MEEVMACRVCLATDVKLYEMCKYRLKTAYESLLGATFSSSDYLRHVCGCCGALLIKFTIFRDRCTRSQQVLEMLMKEHLMITTSHIKTIDRPSFTLPLPYTIQHIQNFDSTQNYYTTTKTQNFDPNNVITQTNITSQNFVSTQNCDHNTSQKFSSTVTTQNFIPINTIQNCDSMQNFSNITIKEENCHANNDNINYDYDDADIKNFGYDNEESIENYYGDLQNFDSDEEPLSKKVKKKRKKHKMKVAHSMKLKKYENVNIKTEDGQNFMPTDQNDDNLLNEQTLSTNEQDLFINDQIIPIQKENDHNVPINDQNLPINNLNIPINEQDLPNQLLDLETDHKLVFLSKEEQIDEVLSRKNSANYLNSVYKCEQCFKGFMTEATYKNHMSRHDPGCGPVVCSVCNTRWPHERALRAHSLISHERRYICKICGHISKSSHKAKEHTQWHAGVTFPCACGRVFARSTSYLTHVRLRHATHACGKCGQTFIGENGLNMHVKKAHRDDTDEQAPGHDCERCLVKFKTQIALQRHCALNSECNDNMSVCVQCGDHFADDQLLKQHTDMHQKNDALRTCSQCSRTFANERSLAAHAQRAHASAHARAPTHCVCEICGYKCMSASSLVNHQRVHSGEKPHACPHCHKRFSVAQRLQIHVRTHTGERPFQCVRCPKAFKHKAALNRHDRVHTGVKPYACPQCGKTFSQSNSMKQHCAGVHMKTYIYSRRNKQL